MSFDFTIRREECMWEKLSKTARPLVLYGTGNGGDKLIDALARFGRTPDGVFASSGFVRQRTFREMPVLSYEQALQQFGPEMTVLVAFGSSLPEVMERMAEVNRAHETYIPELPLFGDDLFTYDYYLAHREEIAHAYSLLADDTSRALFTDMLQYRLRGEMRYLFRTQPDRESYREILGSREIRFALDGGAFRGDSAAVMLEIFPHLEGILACEPDPRTFRKLCEFAAAHPAVLPRNCALSDVPAEMTFHTSGSRGSGVSGANRRGSDTTVQAIPVDSLCADFTPDLIKLDVEGWEAEALEGARQTILRCRPALAVSLYHRARDLFALPLWIERTLPGTYTYHLRRVPCIPAWDLMLYAVPK